MEKAKPKRPKPDVNARLDAKKKREEAEAADAAKAGKITSSLQKAAVDQGNINELANDCVLHLKKEMKKKRLSSTLKRQIALEVVKRVIPRDLVLSDGEKGHSFINLIKELHKKEAKE